MSFKRYYRVTIINYTHEQYLTSRSITMHCMTLCLEQTLQLIKLIVKLLYSLFAFNIQVANIDI